MKSDTTTLEVLARMTGAKIEVKDLVDKWLLLTYDIPQTDEGNRARRKFLDEARMIGATKHTDSVYLMPWTRDAEALALQVARAGDACVWTSTTTDQAMAKEITKNYDQSIQPMLDEISGRLDRIQEHRNEDHHKQADKMMVKTDKMMDAVERAIIRRGSAELYVLMTLIKRRLEGLR